MDTYRLNRCCLLSSISQGSSGAGGNYTRAIVAVTPGASYTVTVGAGGNGGAGAPALNQTATGPQSGTSGTDSQILDSSSTVLATTLSGAAATPNAIKRNALGSTPPAGSVEPFGSAGQGGSGGFGGIGDQSGGGGNPGGTGYALITF